MKYTLHLSQLFSFASNVPFVELEDEKILANNVIFPGEFNPHNCQLWVIGNEFGPVCAVWADCEQDALDTMVDENLGDSFAVDAALDEEDITYLGNASEPFDLSYAWMAVVQFEPARDISLMLSLAEARGANSTNLYR